MAKAKSKSRKKLEEAMREVHTNEPSTVEHANVSEERKEKMRKGIAFTKAKEAGGKYPAKKKGSKRAY